MPTGPLKPELLAPAGDWDALRAAVANGADAVYFGLSDFNARHRAANFTVEELPGVMAFLHQRNVRGYVTLNTLIFSDELARVAQLIEAAAGAGVDALIVQDLGLVRLIHRIAPTLAIHGSTQMTLTEPHGLRFVRELGVERVILARELSQSQIARITQAAILPVEVFVHGALCVSYSGQCLTSESLGGRSANRGQCAQACRLPYDLMVDGGVRDLGERSYLLSPQDLAAHDLIDDLAGLGVVSFKIEGRLKSAHYVAATTQAYRAALDAAIAKQPFRLPDQQRVDLQQSFSRGFTHGFFDGVNHQTLVPARFPKSRGVRVGMVVDVTERGVVVGTSDLESRISHVEEEKQRVPFPAKRAGQNPQIKDQRSEIRDSSPLKPGDGVVFDEGHPEQDEQGGRVFSVQQVGRGRVEIALGEGDVNLSAVAVGSIVWKTDDPAMRRRLEQSFNRDRIVHRRPLHVRVHARVGGALTIEATDASGARQAVTWEGPLQVAQKHPLTVELIREQFGRLGDTAYELGEVELTVEPPGGPGVMVPKSVLNDLRRRVVAEIAASDEASQHHTISDKSALDHLRSQAACGLAERGPEMPSLHILVRSMAQLDAALAWQPTENLPRPASVYAEFEDIRGYPEAVRRARAAGVPIALATVRVIKPEEEGLLELVARAQPNAVLIRNLAGLSFFRERYPGMPMIGDYSLNVANELAADLFRAAGVIRLTPSYDLNWAQMSAMFGVIGAAMSTLFEAVVHQHMPMFHMEHCVFAATLSNGADHRTCGRPCDRHRVELRDRVGQEHPLLADVGCRNTVYNAQAQSAADYIPRMLKLGLRHFRVEMLREDGEQTHQVLDHYTRVLHGIEPPRTARQSLRVLSQLGVTAGTLGFE